MGLLVQGKSNTIFHPIIPPPIPCLLQMKSQPLGNQVQRTKFGAFNSNPLSPARTLPVLHSSTHDYCISVHRAYYVDVCVPYDSGAALELETLECVRVFTCVCVIFLHQVFSIFFVL